MAKAKKKAKVKARHDKPAKTTQHSSSSQASQKQEIEKVDELVKQTGEADQGEARVELCPRCGSTDLGIRGIDIPGFAPEVQVCNKCGFRSESSLETTPVKYFEEVDEEEGDQTARIAEIERRVQSGEYTTAEGKRRTASVKAASRKSKAAKAAKAEKTKAAKPSKPPKPQKAAKSKPKKRKQTGKPGLRMGF